MPYQSRHTRRRTRGRAGPASLFAAGVVGLGCAAVLGVGPALADNSTVTPNTVVFKGSCGLLGVASSAKPSVNGVDDTEKMTVPAGTTITISNKVSKLLGGTPMLSINGQRYTLPGNDSRTFTARSGPVSIGLDPKCPLGPAGAVYKPLALQVNPKASSSPTPGAGDTGSGNTTGTPGSGNHSTASQPGAAAPGHQPASGATPAAPNVHDPVARGAVPSSAAAPGAKSGTSGGGAETSGSTAAPQERAAAPRPVSDVGPSNSTSVLALIAAVCLVGVGAAAVRTVLSQRRNLRV